jgi:hypothetical protein
MYIALWLVFAAFGLMVAWVGLVWSGALRPRYPEGTHYFAGSSLWRAPITLQSPISEAEAGASEREGQAYYIGQFDAAGKLLDVEKRYQRRIFFKVTYFYQNGRLVRQEAVDADGKLTKWQGLPALRDGKVFR